MGLFYTNLAVFGPSRDALKAALKAMKRNAYLSPTIDGHTVVFDKAMEGQNARIIEKLGTTLTDELKCTALASLLHDDDVLLLWLFRNGEIYDHYDSIPGYFDPDAEPGDPVGGDAEVLCLAYGRLDRKKRLKKLLRANYLKGELPKGWGEQERHRAVAAELGIPAIVAGVCYSSIDGKYVPKEFLPDGFDVDSFEKF
jgi:hypothetical protein